MTIFTALFIICLLVLEKSSQRAKNKMSILFTSNTLSSKKLKKKKHPEGVGTKIMLMNKDSPMRKQHFHFMYNA